MTTPLAGPSSLPQPEANPTSHVLTMTKNPREPGSYQHRFVTVYSDNVYHTIDQPPEGWVGPLAHAPTVLCVHGFPDCWYGWRYQIHELAQRGYRVIVPSQLGYYKSSQPQDLRKYSYKAVAYDLNSLLNELGVVGQVTVLGHDWGGAASWMFCQ